jgi:DNA-binding transcriptional MerR regulator
MKIEDKLYSIGQAANITGVQPYVLRYWEKEFSLLRPIKGDGGHRLYRKEDIEKIQYIKELLHHKKYSIAGAKRKLLEDTKVQKKEAKTDWNIILKDIKKDLRNLLTTLEK